jgi:hypothetical protein
VILAPLLLELQCRKKNNDSTRSKKRNNYLKSKRMVSKKPVEYSKKMYWIFQLSPYIYQNKVKTFTITIIVIKRLIGCMGISSRNNHHSLLENLQHQNKNHYPWFILIQICTKLQEKNTENILWKPWKASLKEDGKKKIFGKF